MVSVMLSVIMGSAIIPSATMGSITSRVIILSGECRVERHHVKCQAECHYGVIMLSAVFMSSVMECPLVECCYCVMPNVILMSVIVSVTKSSVIMVDVIMRIVVNVSAIMLSKCYVKCLW
jgi:hypothetical protein